MPESILRSRRHSASVTAVVSCTCVLSCTGRLLGWATSCVRLGFSTAARAWMFPIRRCGRSSCRPIRRQFSIHGQISLSRPRAGPITCRRRYRRRGIVPNSVYPLWKSAQMQEVQANKSLDQLTPNNCNLVLLNIGGGGYTYSDFHQWYTDLAGIVGTPKALASPVITANVFSCAGTVFTTLSGATVGAFAIYR